MSNLLEFTFAWMHGKMATDISHPCSWPRGIAQKPGTSVGNTTSHPCSSLRDKPQKPGMLVKVLLIVFAGFFICVWWRVLSSTLIIFDVVAFLVYCLSTLVYGANPRSILAGSSSFLVLIGRPSGLSWLAGVASSSVAYSGEAVILR